MVTDRAVAEMSAAEVLDFVEDRHAARLREERAILEAAYQWAVLHSPDSLPAADRRGRERARPAGAEGTPRITEHAAATFGARIQTSPYGAKRLIADAVDLVHRLPKLWAGVKAGSVRVGHARHVAEATRELSAEEAGWVDAEVVEVADGRLPWTRFEAVVEGKVAAASPELAKAKEEAAANDLFIRLSRVNKNGVGTLTIRDNIATLMASDVALTAVAKELEEQLPDASLAQRRLAAFALLTNPDAHVDLGVGPVKPKVQIHPADIFPFPVSLSRKVDLDHQIPYSEGGKTSTDNLGPLTRTHHRIKTHANWEVRQPFPGIVIWRDPLGAHYLVDQTGTRQVTATSDDQTPTRLGSPS
jgi:hypothetical protein